MYGYDKLLKDAEYYSKKGVRIESIGKSTQGRDIICFAVGEGGKPLVSTAAIHARENASAYAVLAQLRRASASGEGFTRYFIPLVNPDGAEILSEGIRRRDEGLKKWKANAVGVDLNVNFDARWGQGKQNVFYASGENYVGKSAFSEPETRALARFTEKGGAGMTLSYHTAGREIYWYFFQKENYARDLRLAKYAEHCLRYRYRRIDSDCESAGGYKDWCVEKLGIPALTIELGNGEHPLSCEDIEEDIALNVGLADALSRMINA